MASGFAVSMAASGLAAGVCWCWVRPSALVRGPWCVAPQRTEAAHAQVSHLRSQALQAVVQTSPLDRQRVHRDGLPARWPSRPKPWYLGSHAISREWRVMVVAPVIALAVATAVVAGCADSWWCAAPLIPLFMAIVGWRAQAASEAQMVELGQMNAFLLDRLRGLSTCVRCMRCRNTAQRLRTHAEVTAHTHHACAARCLSFFRGAGAIFGFWAWPWWPCTSAFICWAICLLALGQAAEFGAKPCGC